MAMMAIEWQCSADASTSLPLGINKKRNKHLFFQVLAINTNQTSLLSRFHQPQSAAKPSRSVQNFQGSSGGFQKSLITDRYTNAPIKDNWSNKLLIRVQSSIVNQLQILVIHLIITNAPSFLACFGFVKS